MDSLKKILFPFFSFLHGFTGWLVAIFTLIFFLTKGMETVEGEGSVVMGLIFILFIASVMWLVRFVVLSIVNPEIINETSQFNRYAAYASIIGKGMHTLVFFFLGLWYFLGLMSPNALQEALLMIVSLLWATYSARGAYKQWRSLEEG